MTYTLVGTRYIGSGALPTPVVGYDLVDTSNGIYYISDTSSLNWNQVGSVNSPNLGMLPLAGGTLTGAIQGATGLAPVDSPQFTSSAKLNGINLATTNDLTTTTNTMLDSIAPKINQAVASISAGFTVKGSIAFGTGILDGTSGVTVTIPLPTYPITGENADESDCSWTVGLVAATIPTGLSGSGQDVVLEYSADPTQSRSFTMNLRNLSNGATSYTCKISYMIIGVKS